MPAALSEQFGKFKEFLSQHIFDNEPVGKRDHGAEPPTRAAWQALLASKRFSTTLPYEYFDEAQDFSALEMRLVGAWGEQAGATFLVGDPYQALYTWRGADPTILEAITGERRRVLSRSYRVPRLVRDRAMEWMAGELSRPMAIDYGARRDDDGNDVDGRVDYSGLSLRCGRQIAESARTEADAGRTVMIAATCAYMLFGVVRELRDAGVPFCNPWRTHNGSWNPLGGGPGVSTRARVGALTDPVREGRYWTWAEMASWSHLVSNVFRRGRLKDARERGREKHQRTISAHELHEFVKTDPDVLEEAVRRRDASAACQWLSRCARPERRSAIEFALSLSDAPPDQVASPRVFIGTVHSFKGGEADTVLLFPDLSKVASRVYLSDRESPERDAIARTVYVGMTRARERLVLCSPSSVRSVRW